MANTTVSYIVSDLLPECVAPADAIAHVTPCGREFAVRVEGVAYCSPRYISDDSPSAVAEAIRYRFEAKSGVFTPTISAETLAKQIIRRRPLMVADLLADPQFCRLARHAASKGKTYSQELLQWEKKDVVCEAVAIVRQQIDAEEAVEEDRREKAWQEIAARLERERPLQEAVHAAYEQCGFRTCSQGHEARIEIGDRVGCKADTVKGEEYSRRCTYRKTKSRHTIYVRTDWLTEVHERGLANYQGCLTLDCQVLGHTADRKGIVYRLTYARQGRGTGLESGTVLLVERDGGYNPLRKGAEVIEYKDRRIAHDACIDAGLIAG